MEKRRNIIKQIKENKVYQEILKDSFGGVMYNEANRDKYETKDLLQLWDSLTSSEQEVSGGIMKGAMSFIQGV